MYRSYKTSDNIPAINRVARAKSETSVFSQWPPYSRRRTTYSKHFWNGPFANYEWNRVFIRASSDLSAIWDGFFLNKDLSTVSNIDFSALAIFNSVRPDQIAVGLSFGANSSRWSRYFRFRKMLQHSAPIWISGRRRFSRFVVLRRELRLPKIEIFGSDFVMRPACKSLYELLNSTR